jgi:hypothetical protein
MTMTANATPVSNLFNSTTIYVIPTFQRPYAWEETQWSEMIEDIRTASAKTPPYHYFAPIHIIPVSNPEDSLWKLYTDTGIQDIQELENSGFRNESYGSVNVFLVIDGQQRLTTFYSFMHQYIPSKIKLAKSGFEVPNVILNAPDDQIAFRNLLGLTTPAAKVATVSRAQKRFTSLFSKLSSLISTDPDFHLGNKCHLFFTSSDCETLPVKLSGEVRLAAFTTLNDRGKPLTNLEKVKSLFMEIDDNSSAPKPANINNAFGALYQSVELANSYIDDDEFLRQVAMTLWEGANLTKIYFIDTSGNNTDTDWPALQPDKPRSNYIHQIGADSLYDDYFKKIPTSAAAYFLHQDIVPAIKHVTTAHNALSSLNGQSMIGTPIGTPSFVNSLGLGSRDAIEDYYSVLVSLGLQAKQIGFLLEVCKLYPSLKWHDVLGSYPFDNRSLKSELSQILAQIRSLNQNVDDINALTDQIAEEISQIPDNRTRHYTALQVAETLQLAVGYSKPGRYSSAWNNSFRSSASISRQDFLNIWLHYIFTNGSRSNFVVNIAKSTEAYNNTPWVKYLLKEYEYYISGRNAHRNTAFEIEHFFASAWGNSNPALLTTPYGFSGIEQYKSSFVDTIGNKVALDASLNRALQHQDPAVKVTAYQRHAYGSVVAMTSNPSQSAIDIGNDLAAMSPAQYRVYIQLRSLRLAIFAAKRF